MIMSILPRAILRPSWRISLDIIELDLLASRSTRVDLAKCEYGIATFNPTGNPAKFWLAYFLRQIRSAIRR